MTLFNDLQMQPADPIFGIVTLFKADTRSAKMNLSVGAYQDESGVTPVLNTVKKAEKLIEERPKTKSYLPISGNAEFCREAEFLIYGHDHPAIIEKRVNTAQTIGATGALRIGGEFLKNIGVETIAISNPSWPNHKGVMTNARLNVSTYTYYDAETKGLDFEGMLRSIQELPENTAILLHTCCHNPTGLDPTPEQWQLLSATIKEHKLIPFFDCAYQGFKTNLDEDAYPIRLFAQQGHNLMVAYSFAKNMGLYGERAGVLSCVSDHADSTAIIESYLKKLIRASYSNPPIHSAEIVHTILSESTLKKEWVEEVASMRLRIHKIRDTLMSKMCSLQNGENYQFLKDQCGMFGYIGLNSDQVQHIRDEYAVYMTNNGRINVAGLNNNNINGFIHAFRSVSQPS
ncbi:MAG: amino acid aminotransferase [Chlamydiota bacterium]